jgi:hypothetical protein
MQRSGQDARLIEVLTTAYAGDAFDLDSIADEVVRGQVREWSARSDETVGHE